jgi:hypothetical protein
MVEDYYGLDGQPISRDEFVKLWRLRQVARGQANHGESLPEDDPSRIGSDRVGDAWISTVWLGIDHGYGHGPPIIFETMIFGGRDDGFQARYATKEAALAGHRRVVEAVKYGSVVDGSIGPD